MEIERINENTVKFYISYVDIENRGFEREEIWYNRERSEQLFWQMMDEVNYKEDFSVEGPLWIQVQALEKGLEIIVTRAQVSQGETPLDAIDNIEEAIDLTITNKAKSNFTNGDEDEEDSEQPMEDAHYWTTVEFSDLEDIIQLSHYFHSDFESDIVTALYHYEDRYYLYVEITPDILEDQHDILSQILEYGNDSNVTYHVLDEYGKTIIAEHVFAEMRKHFDAVQV